MLLCIDCMLETAILLAHECDRMHFPRTAGRAQSGHCPHASGAGDAARDCGLRHRRHLCYRAREQGEAALAIPAATGSPAVCSSSRRQPQGRPLPDDERMHDASKRSRSRGHSRSRERSRKKHRHLHRSRTRSRDGHRKDRRHDRSRRDSRDRYRHRRSSRRRSDDRRRHRSTSSSCSSRSSRSADSGGRPRIRDRSRSKHRKQRRSLNRSHSRTCSNGGGQDRDRGRGRDSHSSRLLGAQLPAHPNAESSERGLEVDTPPQARPPKALPAEQPAGFQQTSQQTPAATPHKALWQPPRAMAASRDPRAALASPAVPLPAELDSSATYVGSSGSSSDSRGDSDSSNYEVGRTRRRSDAASGSLVGRTVLRPPVRAGVPCSITFFPHFHPASTAIIPGYVCVGIRVNVATLVSRRSLAALWESESS